VCAAAGVDATAFPDLYSQIQQGLFEAVGHVHVPWEDVIDQTLPQIRAELRQYRRVFSTNYDLLVYWAMMCEGDPNDFRDFFGIRALFLTRQMLRSGDARRSSTFCTAGSIYAAERRVDRQSDAQSSRTS
jgi:hypothetical protein